MSLPKDFIDINLAFSRTADQTKRYVQDLMRERATTVAELLRDDNTYIYVCGLRGMEAGVLEVLGTIASQGGLPWDVSTVSCAPRDACTSRPTDAVRRVLRRPGGHARSGVGNRGADYATSREFDPQWCHVDPRSGRARPLGSAHRERLAHLRHGDEARLRPPAGGFRVGRLARGRLREVACPVRANEPLALRVEVLEVRRPRRRPELGVLRWRWRLDHEDGRVALELEATSLFQLDR